MTVRQKITMLITAAGFLSSLIFSVIISWEMVEQPFRIIDSDLRAVARRAVHIVCQRDQKRTQAVPSFDGIRYWLKIYDQDSGKLIYRSYLARQIEIPEPLPGFSSTVGLIIPREKIELGQDQQNEVTFRVRSYKILLDGRNYLVSAARSMERLQEELWDIFMGVVSGLIFSVLLLMAISYFLSGFMLKPLRIINEQARDISEKHLDRRLPVIGDHDEFNALAQTLNRVFDRLQYAFLRQKRLLADASHELKTPLTMMRLALDEIRSAYDENSSRLQAENLGRLTEQVLRMERLVKNLLGLSSLEIQGTTTKETVDVADVLASLLADYRFLANTRNIQIEARLPRQLLTDGNVDTLKRAFSNILDNAIKYNVDGGRIEVIGTQSSVDLAITVTNTGRGVAKAEIDKVFDQFYRVEQSRSLQHGGSGLGLAIVKRIVELHNGLVKFESQQGDWTRVTVNLPRHREEISV